MLKKISQDSNNNILIIGRAGSARKTKIVLLSEFSFNMLPNSWTYIKKFIDINDGIEKVVFEYNL